MTIIETHTVPTARCQPWCRAHDVDTYEAHHYDGTPHVWHYGEPIEVAGNDGRRITVELRMYEPASDPAAAAPYVAVSPPHGAEGLFSDDATSIRDCRLVAQAILELCDRADAGSSPEGAPSA